jgi:hypothetical protein
VPAPAAVPPASAIARAESALDTGAPLAETTATGAPLSLARRRQARSLTMHLIAF